MFLFPLQERLEKEVHNLEKLNSEAKISNDSYEKEIKEITSSLETEKLERKKVSLQLGVKYAVAPKKVYM